MTKVKLQTGRVAFIDGQPVSQSHGSTIEVPDDEAARLVEDHQAVIETAMTGPQRNAALITKPRNPRTQ